jgi:hypothetical protein
MTYLKTLLLAVGLTVSLSALSPVLAQSSPNLEMSKDSLKWQQTVSFDPRSTASKSGSDENDYFQSGSEARPLKGLQTKPTNPEGIGKVAVAAHNTGTKTIKAVTWEYTFFSDAEMSQTVQRYRIHSNQQIRVGETKVLKGTVKSYPYSGTQTLLFTKQPSKYRKVVPLRIEYTDGTIWESL